MTIETGLAVIYVILYLTVVFIHIRLVMLVTIDAAENGPVTRIDVTSSTIIPFLVMFAGIDGEIQWVMIPELALFSCRMTAEALVTVVTVGGDPLMTVVHRGPVVFVTIQARKEVEITRNSVAIQT